MSRDIRQYWQEVRELETSLPEFVWLAAVDGSPDVTQAPAGVAARLLKGKSHRTASEEEISVHFDREREANRAAREEQMRRKGTSLVVVRGEKGDKKNSKPLQTAGSRGTGAGRRS